MNFQVDVNQTQGFINGSSEGLNNKTMGFGMMFTHELLHTDIGMGELHGKETYEWGSTGRVVDAMNAIRRQMGQDYGQRRSYLGFTYNGKTHLPFDSHSKTFIFNQINVQIKHGYMKAKLSPVNGKYLSF